MSLVLLAEANSPTLKNPQKAKRKTARKSEASYEELQINGKIGTNRANRENVIGRLLSFLE